MTTIIALVVIAFVAYRATPTETRQRLLEGAIETVRHVNDRGRTQLDPFRTALRAQRPHVYATFVIAAIDVAVFSALILGKGSLDDPDTMIAWGANFGPRTANGEWWRLLTAAFVHAGPWSLLIEIAALAQMGATLERLAGPLAFVLVYITGALVCGIVNLSMAPLGVHTAGSGAILALCAMLIVIALRSWRRKTVLSVPPAALKRSLPVMSLFVVYAVASGTPGWTAAFVIAATAVFFTLIAVGDVTDEPPSTRRLAYGFGVVAIVSAAAAAPMRGVEDVRPELQRLVMVEEHTSEIYQSNAGRFRSGVMTAGALAKMIDEAIVPELQAADERIRTMTGVPSEDRQRVADAREYIRLRSESWRLRAAGLRSAASLPTDPRGALDADEFRSRATARYRATTLTLGRAESAERAALETLQRTNYFLPGARDQTGATSSMRQTGPPK